MFLLLVILVLIYNVGETLSRLYGSELSIGVEFLYRAAFICGVGWWLQAEMRRHNTTRVYCRGLMIHVAWPIVIPYYLYQSRGLKALIPIAILIGVFILAQFVAVFGYILLDGPGVR